MKRNFLLMLLLTLLPLAGWAKDFNATVTPQASTMVWGTDANAAIQYTIAYAGEEPNAERKATFVSLLEAALTATLSSTNVGTQTYTISGDASYNLGGPDKVIVTYDDTPATMEITKATVKVEAYGVSQQFTDPFVAPSFDVIGASAIVTGGPTWDEVKAYLNVQCTGSHNVGTEKYSLIKISDPANYNLIIDNSGADLTITQATTNNIYGLTIDNWTYDGTPSTPSITGADFGKDKVYYQYYTVPGDVEVADIATADAGDYKVMATIDATTNYTFGTDVAYFTISKRPITAADYTLPTAVENLQYTLPVPNQVSSNPSQAGWDLHTALVWKDGKERGTVEYMRSDTPTDWKTTLRWRDDAGNWTISTRITPDANHTINGGTAAYVVSTTPLPVSIAKADLTPADMEGMLVENLKYTGSPVNLLKGEAYLPELNGTGITGTFTYYIGSTSVGTDWNAVVGEAADTYEIYYTFAPTNTNRYNAITTPQKIGDAIIAQGTNEVTAGPVMSSVTYPNVPTVTTDATTKFGGTPTYTFSQSETEGFVEASAVEVWHAGTWYVKTDVAETTDYSAATKTTSFTIAQAPLNLGMDPLTVTYANTPVVTADMIVEQVVHSDTWVASETPEQKLAVLNAGLTITTSKDGGAPVEGFGPILEGNAGKYTIAIAPKLGAVCDYEIKYYSTSTTVTIDKAKPTITDLAITGWTYGEYDDVANAPSANADFKAAGEPTFTYSNSETGTFTAEVPVNAGTWYVKASVAEGDNWEAAEAVTSFQIAKSTAQVFTWTQTGGFAYGAPAVLPVATALENAAITYEYRKDGESSYVAASAIEDWTAGKWFVKATAAETDNYFEVVSADQEFTVSQATNAITDFAIVGWTYGEYDDVANAPTASATFGVPTFTYSDSETGTFTDEVPVDAGTWYVKASVAGTDDYDAAEQVISFKIEKAQVTDIVPPVKIDRIYNAEAQTLVSAAKFSDGEPKGTFEYSLSETGTYTADIPTGIDAGDYTVFTKFIPDNNHYETTVASVPAAIAPLVVTYSLTTIDNWEYNGEEVKYAPEALFTLVNPSVLPGKDGFTAPFKFIFPEDVTVKDAKDYEFYKLDVEWTDKDKQNYAPKFQNTGKFTITPKALTEKMITLNPASAEFTGDNITVGVTVKDGEILTFGGEKTDVTYEITKDGNKVENGKINAAGEYKFTFTAQNNYTGTVVVPFTVGGMGIASMLKVTKGNWDDVVYDGTSQAPEFKLSYTKGDKEVVLQKGTDYEVYIWKPIKPNTGLGVDPKDVKDVAFEGKAYTFSIEAKGNYSGKIEKFKKILPKALKAEDVRTMAKSAEYTSKGQMPEYKLASNLKGDLLTNLNEGSDFDVLINGVPKTDETKLTDADTYTFEFIGKNNYSSTIERDFIITPATVLVQAGSYEKFYNGKVGAEGAEVVDGDVDWTYSGLKGDDGFDAKSVVVADGALIVEKASANVGTYQLAVDATKFSVSSNYTFAAADKAYQGTLTIKKAPVTLGFENEKDKKPFYSVSKVYGAKDSSVDYLAKVVVLENEEESPIATELNTLANKVVNAKTGEKAMTFARATAGTEEVGTYDNDVQISFNAGVFGNYDVTTTAGNFEITKADLIVALTNDIEVVYDGAVPTEEVEAIDPSMITISGAQWDDDYSILEEVKGEIVSPSKNVGTYVLKLTAKAHDYTVKTLDARVIITPAPLTVSIADQTVYVGAKDEDLDMGAATIKGIIGNDAVEAKMVLNVSTAAPVVADKGVKLTIGNTNYQIVEKEKAVEAAYGKLIVLAKEDIALDDTKAYTLPEKETTADVTFTTRVVNEDTWNVCVLPFETSPAEISDAFGYAAVDVLDDTRDDGNIHFQIVTSGVIPAGTPFIFKPSKDADDAVADFNEVTFESVKIVKSFAAPVTVDENGNTYVTDKAGNKFWGTFKSTSFYGKQYWYMSKGAWKDASKFTDAKPVTVKPFRAFVEFVTPAAGRIFIEEPDGTETAIDAIQFNQMVNGEATYTLDGKKVNNVTQKGIYIKDGKKVAVK